MIPRRRMLKAPDLFLCRNNQYLLHAKFLNYLDLFFTFELSFINNYNLFELINTN